MKKGHSALTELQNRSEELWKSAVCQKSVSYDVAGESAKWTEGLGGGGGQGAIAPGPVTPAMMGWGVWISFCREWIFLRGSFYQKSKLQRE